MSNFKASTEKPKKHIKEITTEYLPFWQTYFEHEGVTSPKFGAKLCYMGKEFGDEREECVRFWPSELSCGKDFYVELFNWDHDHYDRDNRRLYKLPYNADWKNNNKSYVPVETGLESTTYAVKLSDLELVNITPITAAYADVSVKTVAYVYAGKDDHMFDDLFTEKEDAHYSSMTMRDHYCMTHNVPLSNKKWLNELIKTATAWQQKNQK